MGQALRGTKHLLPAHQTSSEKPPVTGHSSEGFCMCKTSPSRTPGSACSEAKLHTGLLHRSGGMTQITPRFRSQYTSLVFSQSLLWFQLYINKEETEPFLYDPIQYSDPGTLLLMSSLCVPRSYIWLFYSLLSFPTGILPQTPDISMRVSSSINSASHRSPAPPPTHQHKPCHAQHFLYIGLSLAYKWHFQAWGLVGIVVLSWTNAMHCYGLRDYNSHNRFCLKLSLHLSSTKGPMVE